MFFRKSTSAAIAIGRGKDSRKIIQSIDAESKPSNELACEMQPKDQLFDFVHIRYQRSSIEDGARLLRLAFEQTKPGGWIEVVETGAVSRQTRQQRLPRATPTDIHSSSRTGLAPDNAADWIKQQLLETGFVDVEEKGRRPPSSTAGICHRVAGIGRTFKSWCLGFLGLQWNCDSPLLTVTDHNPILTDEKGSNSMLASSRAFIIARRP